MAAFVTDLVKLIERVFGPGLADRSRRNFYVRCPICAPKDRSKLKLVILLEDSKVHCWACGYKARSLAPLIRRFGSRDELAEYCNRYAPEGANPTKLLTTAPDDEPQKLQLPDDFRLLATAMLRDPDAVACLRYLQDRDVSERDMWYFKLGYSNQLRWRRRIIVPSFDAQGQLNYFTARAIDPLRRPKYDNPGCDRAPIVFNELNIDWMQPLVLCEGPFDLFKCPDNSVPLLGSELTEGYALFALIAEHKTPVTLALDADVRFTKLPRIAKRLAGYDVHVSLAEVPSDPGSLSKQRVQQLVDGAKQVSWSDSFRDKLERASRTAL